MAFQHDEIILADVKVFLGVEGTAEDDLISELLDVATSYIEAQTGMVLERLDTGDNDIFKYFPCDVPYVVRGGRRLLFYQWMQFDSSNPGNVLRVEDGSGELRFVDPLYLHDGNHADEGDASAFAGLVLMRHPRHQAGDFKGGRLIYGVEMWPTGGRFVPDAQGMLKLWRYPHAITRYWPYELRMAVLLLCQYLYQSMFSGTGGETFIASRQTGLIVQPAEVPAHIRMMIDAWKGPW